MTFINRMIKQAKTDPKPVEFTIRANQINQIAEYVIGSTSLLVPSESNKLFVQNQILLGRVKLLDIPIRVVGK